MGRIELSEARNAFFTGDYETAYALFAGDELKEADQILYQKAGVILRMQHACETYENHKKMGKKLQGLDDLIQGLAFYFKLIDEGNTEILSQQAIEQYSQILRYLSEDFSLSEEEAQEIVYEEDDYIYSLKLEAIAEGRPYIPPEDAYGYQNVEIQNEEMQNESMDNSGQNSNEIGEEDRSEDGERIIEPVEVEIHLEDALPEEEEYLNDSNN